MVAEHLFVLQSAQEFQFAKLFRLKAAGRLQLPAKCQEMGRQHGLENRELLHQYASDLGAAPQQPRRLIRFVVRLRIRSGTFQIRNHSIHVMEQFLEPQFVSLMHDDEQHLIVVLRRRLRTLQLQQFRNF